MLIFQDFAHKRIYRMKNTFISSHAGICRLGKICPVLNRPAEASYSTQPASIDLKDEMFCTL